MKNGSELMRRAFTILATVLAVGATAWLAAGCPPTDFVDPVKVQELILKRGELNAQAWELQAQIEKERYQAETLKKQAEAEKDLEKAAKEGQLTAEKETGDLQKLISEAEGKIAELKLAKEATLKEINKIDETMDALWQLSGGDGGGGAPCFAIDTMVLMADRSVKRIGEIKAGESVLAYDVASGQVVAARVTGTGTGLAGYYYLVNGSLKVTPPHPFFTVDSGWVKVENLKAGQSIKSHTGETLITTIQKVDEGQRIGNIMVQGFGNFFVSADGEKFYLVQES